MKKKLIVLFLFLFVSSAFCFSISKSEFLKGDQIEIVGPCDKMAAVQVSAGNNRIFSGSKDCVAGKIEFVYQIDSTDPAGQWKILFGEDTFNIFVSPTKMLQFYVINMLSPSTLVSRTMDTNVQVKITDNKQPVEDANVYFWGVKGEKIEMDYLSDGIYSREYEIPFDANLGTWSISVVAASQASGHGGETVFSTQVVRTAVLVDVIEPHLQSIDLGEEIQILVRAKYQNKKSLVNPIARAHINSKIIEMALGDNDQFSLVYLSADEDEGPMNIGIEVFDGAGNSGAESCSIVVVKGIQWYLRNYFIWIFVAAFVVLAALALSKKIILRKSEMQLFLDEKKELESVLDSLQENYFEKNLVNKETFFRRSAELSSKISEIEKQISKIKKPKNKGKIQTKP